MSKGRTTLKWVWAQTTGGSSKASAWLSRTWPRFWRSCTELWLLYWLTYVGVWIFTFVYAFLIGLFTAVINRINNLPGPFVSGVGVVTGDTQVNELAKGRLLWALGWWAALVVPAAVTLKRSWPKLGLSPFDPSTVPTIVRHLRLRAGIRKIWAAILVFLIVTLLGTGILLFYSVSDTGPLSLPPHEKDQSIYTIEISRDINSTIALAVGKIGAVVILIFLVNILAKMYSNNIKLAVHYELWADALQLAGTNFVELEQYIKALDPGKIPLEKPPKSPVQEMVAGLKGIEKNLEKLK